MLKIVAEFTMGKEDSKVQTPWYGKNLSWYSQEKVIVNKPKTSMFQTKFHLIGIKNGKFSQRINSNKSNITMGILDLYNERGRIGHPGAYSLNHYV